MTYLDQSLGQLARRIPGATRLFDQHHLDFCCAGNRTLRTAAEEAGIEAEPIVNELHVLQQRTDDHADRDWGGASDSELINHILVRYHAVHREQLPELVRLARRVEHVHGERPNCPHGLADHLEAMAQELDSHMRKEELVLFPMITHSQGGIPDMPIAVMRMEHDSHGAELRRLSELTNDITTPRDACNTWRALYLGLRTFREDLMAHIHTENNILFERFAPAQIH
ncbi:iron-sulfur cluster repair protein YtfE [Ottowia thiooxydans]|uniref:iron-sulfur cluster repair protein YtfE n=1 Tax=Ottowia thiooxydans TaxID=219182 RepID=UPI000422FA9B|nr:iron-sulfur cluster repair protein YtfE [Ottowia thiooxydans]